MGWLKWLISGSFLRILFVLILLGLALVQYPSLVRFDDWLYASLSRFRPPSVTEQVVVVAIDVASVQQIGSFPWPRTYLAEGVKALQSKGIKAIGLLPSLLTPEWNPGLAGLRTLLNKLPDKKELISVRKSLADMEVAIDGDRQLKEAVQTSGSVVISLFPAGEWVDQPQNVLDSKLNWNAPKRSWQVDLASLHNPFREWLQTAPPFGINSSFEVISTVATHGFIAEETALLSPHFPLISPQIADYYFPSFALQLARLSLSKESLLIMTENRMKLADREWQTGEGFSILIPPVRMAAQPIYSYVDLVKGKIDAKLLQGKAVVVGLTTDRTESRATLKTAAVVADLLSGSLSYRPHWAFLPELAVLCFFAIFVVLIIPRLNAWFGSFVLLFFVACWVGVVTGLLVFQGLWFQLAPVLVMVVVGSLIAALQRIFKSRATGYEDLKLLGLSLQGQGMLDMAFDKFMQCPVHDPAVQEILYNLGLDFERKRMFSKAVTVYQHLLKGGKFKDAKKKVVELEEMEGTIILGSSGSGKNDGLRLVKGRTAPTLGRYEVVRELGQGAMGTVYLGRDPKINREVAIKTLNIREIEPQLVEEVKRRFYREAEAAGGLNHPNIVTIYDAGEEHDLAYMAMEYIDGQTLALNCVKEHLLAPVEVLRIAAEIADALAYAHDNDVIHRDIKPANIMLIEGGKVKVTDFGIARVVNSSHTQTGTILGTPSYMSPEQVAGKKVDGRSDQFSLGVVCYELLTGDKPFAGENLGALMFSISKGEYVPLSDKVKRLPKGVYEIVGKLLSKGVTGRYKSSHEVAQALRECSSRMRKV
jgi:serine/threonine-protein kinase